MIECILVLITWYWHSQQNPKAIFDKNFLNYSTSREDKDREKGVVIQNLKNEKQKKGFQFQNQFNPI